MKMPSTLLAIACAGAALGFSNATLALDNAAEGRALVLAHECRQFEIEKDGFSCAIEKNYVHLRLAAEPRSEYMRYRLHAFILRFLDLGGQTFFLHGKFVRSYGANPTPPDDRPANTLLCGANKGQRYEWACHAFPDK